MNNSDDIRMVWLFLIIPIYMIGTIVSSRLIFVEAATIIYTVAGVSQEQAITQAQEFINTIECQVILQAIDLLVMTALVFFLMKKVEKREFNWSAIGLEWKNKSLIYFGAGIVLVTVLKAISIGVSLLQGTARISSLNTAELFTGPVLKYLVLFLAWVMLNGFWQEIVFRGYLQTRCVERYGVVAGVLIATVYFVLVHFVDRTLDPLWVIVMIIMFILLGLMYHQTKSLYLVGAVHGMINYFSGVLDLLGIELTHSYSVYYVNDMIIFGVALVVILGVNHMMEKRRIPQSVNL